MRLFVLFAFLVGASAAWSADRVALLVGNATYAQSALSLKNPVNDVTALSDRLRSLDFEVFEVRNGTRAEMRSQLADFSRAAKGAEMALFFYAGHGVQISGENYLIGTEIATLTPEALIASSLSMSEIREAVNAAQADIGIVVLDACRNNPLAESGGIRKGLARTAGGAGLLIAYATDPGNVAYDGSGDNSVFTSALVDNIALNGLDVRLMFGRVRQQVIRATRGAQIPWVEESVLGEHYIGEPVAGDEATVALESEIAAWRAASEAGETEALDAYLDAYPQGLFADMAKNQKAAIRAGSDAPVFPGTPTGVLLASAETDRVQAALSVLGFVPETRALVPLDAVLEPAFDAYREQLAEPEFASVDQLYQDAARATIYLAASTAQRIRTDLAALASLDKTLEVAAGALVELRQVAGDTEAGQTVIASALVDIASIEAAREVVLRRLDESRSYYDTLIQSAQINFEDQVTPDLVAGGALSRGAGGIEQRLVADASLFVNQVKTGDEATRGSYSWMVDFLPGG